MFSASLCKIALVAAFAHCALAFTTPVSLSLQKDLHFISTSRQRPASVVMQAQGNGNKLSPVSRRLFASLLFAASVGVPKAMALTEEEEFLLLQTEAQRISGVINSQKKAFGGVVAGDKPVVTKQADQVASFGPNPFMGPQDVVKAMMAALKQNDPKDNSGLKTVLEFTASTNPILENPQYFERMMINSKYSLLLGHFTDFAITNTENYKDETGQPMALVGMKVMAPYRTMLVCGVPFEDMEYMEDKITASVCINWQLSKDPKSGSWLSDTMYFKKPAE